MLITVGRASNMGAKNIFLGEKILEFFYTNIFFNLVSEYIYNYKDRFENFSGTFLWRIFKG
jgi:hypothetical protein